MAGYVYLLGSKVFGWYKIGKCKKPSVRLGAIGILLPFKIELIALWQSANHGLLEVQLHERFKEYRINGEWFHFTNGQVDSLVAGLVHMQRFDAQAIVQNIDEDIVGANVKIRKPKDKLAGRAFLAGMKAFMESRGLKDTPDNRKLARIAVRDEIVARNRAAALDNSKKLSMMSVARL